MKDLNLDVGNIDAALLSVILSQIGIYYSSNYFVEFNKQNFFFSSKLGVVHKIATTKKRCTPSVVDFVQIIYVLSDFF